MRTIETEQLRLTAIGEHEARMIYGGAKIPAKWVAIALLMSCPALGVFHMGVMEGYREEAAGR